MFLQQPVEPARMGGLCIPRTGAAVRGGETSSNCAGAATRGRSSVPAQDSIPKTQMF